MLGASKSPCIFRFAVLKPFFSEGDGKQVINLRLNFNCNNAPNESKWELGAAFEVIFYFFE